MNEDLQYALIGDLLSPVLRPRTLELIKRRNLSPEAITKPELRTAYDILVAEESNDLTILLHGLNGKISQATLDKANESAAATVTDVDRHISTLHKDASLKKMREIVDKKINENSEKASFEFILGEVQQGLREFSDSVIGKAATTGFSLAELSEPIPEDENPNSIISGNFIRKGMAFVLTSVTGSGKSVITMQLAYSWAIGRAIFDIKPVRPLKIGIFQTEDDEEDMAGFRQSMREGYRRFCDWSDEDIKRAEQNILLYPVKGRQGKEFIQFFHSVQRAEKCDLVVINPLQGVIDGDLSDNSVLQEFTRKDIDDIISRDEESKCALMLVHHTNKPPAANMRAGFGTDQYAQYVGSGGAALVNWARAILSIIPTSEDGQYYLVAAKRGDRLNWTQPNIKNVKKPARLIRHSTREEGLTFWHEVSSAEASIASKTATPIDAQQQLKVDAESVASKLKEKAVTLTEARKIATGLFGVARGTKAYNEVRNNPDKYDLEITATGASNCQQIGPKKR